MQPYLDVFGRLHPLLLHLPIGLLVGVLALEAVNWCRGGKAAAAPAALLWLSAAAALAAVATGFVLSYEEGYGGLVLDLHMWLGIAFAAVAVVAAVARSAKTEARPSGMRVYQGTLLASLGLMIAAGHFGATMTHGENFLFEPLGRPVAEAGGGAISVPADPVSFEALGPASAEGFVAVAPILSQKCASCHSGSVSKAGLALESFEAVAHGSDAGAILDPEDPAAGELLRRLKLPPDDPDHMPPKGKRQLTPEELSTLEAWIVGGAVTSSTSAVAGGEDAGEAPSEGVGEPAHPAPPSPGLSGVGPPDKEAVAALAGTLAHVSPLAEGSELLWVDVSHANPPLDNETILGLLRPLAGNVAELSLARCDVTDAFAPVAADMPNLARLNLSGTAITDGTVAALAGHGRLQELVLANTAVTDASVGSLLAMPALERVYLWGSGCTAEGVAGLQASRPDLVADAGQFPDSAVLAVEPPPKLVDAATTGPAAPAAPLAAVNTMCPVSGTAVDAKYLVVYEGRVIGFCCPDCPKQFWADPAKYAAKISP